MFTNTVLKFLSIAMLVAISFNVQSENLASISSAISIAEISGLGNADSKFAIKSISADKVSLEKIALNSGVGMQGQGQIVERSEYCSTGCSTGCSNGCSTGCSYGCR